MAEVVEYETTVNGKVLSTYMVPGSCTLRSIHGISGKHSYNRLKGKDELAGVAEPQEILQAIVASGIGGSVMILTDAYTDGVVLKTFKLFVESQGLGVVTLTPGIKSAYTHNRVYTAILEYKGDVLENWYRNQEGFPPLVKDGWVTTHDKQNIDAVFYSFGGRPKRPVPDKRGAAA
jgi:hypothetical protein